MLPSLVFLMKSSLTQCVEDNTGFQFQKQSENHGKAGINPAPTTDFIFFRRGGPGALLKSRKIEFYYGKIPVRRQTGAYHRSGAKHNQLFIELVPEQIKKLHTGGADPER
jgi:hypothetical protein